MFIRKATWTARLFCFALQIKWERGFPLGVSAWWKGPKSRKYPSIRVRLAGCCGIPFEDPWWLGFRLDFWKGENSKPVLFCRNWMRWWTLFLRSSFFCFTFWLCQEKSCYFLSTLPSRFCSCRCLILWGVILCVFDLWNVALRTSMLVLSRSICEGGNCLCILLYTLSFALSILFQFFTSIPFISFSWGPVMDDKAAFPFGALVGLCPALWPIFGGPKSVTGGKYFARRESVENQFFRQVVLSWKYTYIEPIS